MPARAIPAIALLVAAAVGSCAIRWDDADGRPQFLQDYVDAHYRELGERFVHPMDREDLLAALRDTRILFLGDQHRDVRLHGQMLELLDYLCDHGVRPVIGLESVGSQDNPSLQEFVSGGIDLATLRSRIRTRWPGSWLERDDVDQSFYRELLAQVRRRGLDAFPLEPTPRRPLAERDAVIAAAIRRALRLHPDRLVVVVVGHAHVHGTGHLAERLTARSLTIAARCSPVLTRALTTGLPVDPDAFLRTDRDVLFFPRVVTGPVID